MPRLSKLFLASMTFVIFIFAVPTASADPINIVSPGTLSSTSVVTFDDVPGGADAGTNYDGILRSVNTSFAERFVGQTRTSSGNFDVLSGTPTSLLALQVGAPNQNLLVNLFGPTGNVMAGLGPTGFPNFNAVGEGSFAVLFDFDQSEFGFDLFGGGGGTATVDFFRRDGSLIQRLILSSLSDQSYAFRREGSLRDIAGISIFNNDPNGIAFDNLRSDVPGVSAVPEPTTMLLLGTGLAGIAAKVRRRRKARQEDC